MEALSIHNIGANHHFYFACSYVKLKETKRIFIYTVYRSTCTIHLHCSSDKLCNAAVLVVANLFGA